ncbi:WecB/TagA/CpsF family glycosyltransferase [Verrucomicrobiaceae bacterium R5-34]|nr:WecB/TagA/CpsF family glycosyltransferase [Verrucomicrobiaceae bacterium R5-34]
MPTPFQSFRVLGTPVAVVTKESAAAQVIAWADRGDRAYAIEAADVHVVTRARHEPEFGECMSRFDMVCPDGMPVLWSVNRELPENDRLTERVCGADLMQETMRQTAEKGGQSHFLLGGAETTLEKLVETLPEKVPRVRIAGSYSPPFGEWPADEFERICQKITESGASHVWVGLGCPKQERWISENKQQLPPACYYGVGAAFAFHAGEISRAPRLFQKTGTEWLYRVICEPRRLWKRYFTYNSLFIRYQLFE